MTDKNLQRAKEIKGAISNLEERLGTAEKIILAMQEKKQIYRISVSSGGQVLLNLSGLSPETMVQLERAFIEQAISNLENEFNKL